LMDAARSAGAAHACWSGAGPTVLAFTTTAARGRVIGAMGGVLGMSGEVLALRPDYEGLI
jgi:homoserine kinase